MSLLARATSVSLLSVLAIVMVFVTYPYLDDGLQVLSRMGCYLLYLAAYFLWFQVMSERTKDHELWALQLYLVIHPLFSLYYLPSLLRRVP